MAALVIVTGYTSINAVVKAELFPGHIRALGVALPYAIANTLFGGTAEYVALALKDAGHERWFYIYVSVVIGFSLITYATMRDTKAHEPRSRTADLALQISFEIVAQLFDRLAIPLLGPWIVLIDRNSPGGPGPRHQLRRELGLGPTQQLQVEWFVELEAELVAAGPVDGREMLAGVTQVEQQLHAQRILNWAFDQRAMLGNIAQPHLLIVVRKIDLAHPHQRMAPLGAAAVGDGIVVVLPASAVTVGLPILRDSAGRRPGKLRWMTSSSRASRAFGIAVDPCLVREFQADPVFAHPADGAFDFGAFGENQVDPFPQPRCEVASDHRAAARQVDHLNVMHFAVKAGAGSFLLQPVTVVVALIARCAFRCARPRPSTGRLPSAPRFFFCRTIGSPECRPFPERIAERKLFIETTSHAMAR